MNFFCSIFTAFEKLLSTRPLIILTVAFAFGILAGSHIAGPFMLSGLLLILSVVCVRHPRLRRVALVLAFSAIGSWRSTLASIQDTGDVARFTESGFVTVHGIIAGDSTYRPAYHSWRINTEIQADSVTLSDGRTLKCTGLVVAWLTCDAGSQPPDFGVEVTARGRLEKPPGIRNEGGFDYSSALARRRIFAIFTARHPTDWRSTGEAPAASTFFGRFLRQAKGSLNSALSASLPQTEANLLAGVLIGSRSQLPGALNDDFVATGTVHILATAGLHVGIMAAFVFGLLSLIRFPKRAAAFCTIVILLLYAELAGGRPSVVRAALMASFYLGAILLDREPDAPSALAGAALFILGVSPSSLYDAGFQLSFATVMVLAAALPLFHPFLLRIRHADFRLSGPLNGLAAGAGYYLAGTVVLSTLAQLGSAPLVAHYFNQVSWVGIIANALIVPVVTLLICGGFLLWLMASMSPVIGGTLGTLFISPLLAYVIGVAGYFSHLHRAVLSIPDPGWLLIFAYYTVVAGIIALGYSRQRKPVAVWSEQAVVPISEEGAALMEKTHG